MVSGLLLGLLDNIGDTFSPYDIECTINELENDCDTLENEANRLLTINRELRIKLGSDDVTEEDLSEITSEFTTEKSFASEITENLSNATESQTQTQESTPEIERPDQNERPGPEGEEKEEIDSLEQRQEDETKPRYTLFELEEVLNEKNKYKGMSFPIYKVGCVCLIVYWLEFRMGQYSLYRKTILYRGCDYLDLNGFTLPMVHR